MKKLALAVAGSFALHAAAFAALPRARLEPRPVPASVELEVSLSGGAASEPRAVAARSEPARRPQTRWVFRRTSPTPNATSTPTPNATSTPTPTGTPTPNATATATAIGLPTPRLQTTLADLDLSAFFGRLQRAAERCSGPRPGEGKIRFCVGANGAPIDVALVQSTGNFALDDAALHCVIPGAAPFPHTERCLVVPLVFR